MFLNFGKSALDQGSTEMDEKDVDSTQETENQYLKLEAVREWPNDIGVRGHLSRIFHET